MMPTRMPDFSGNSNETIAARLARLLIIQLLYNRGLLPEKVAKEVLSGSLTPGDETTIYDDRSFLEVKL